MLWFEELPLEGEEELELNHASWKKRWKSDQPGFHQAAVNPRLKEHTSWLLEAGDAGIYLPLCGATLDMDWLAQHFERVVGTEFVEEAVLRFFNDRSLSPQVIPQSRYKAHTAGRVTILHGDALVLTPQDRGPISAWYDRAAMIALRSELRRAYVNNLKRNLPRQARGLLITLQYEQSIANGPPWSVSQDEVLSAYSDWCDVERVFHTPATRLPPRFGDALVYEDVYRLVRRD
ncbi:MAG: thiopurine S-methyltransferase [Myxococcota bacterium]|nr:thiopurine S-methyltransferase [Myxococcota bacterium]